MGGAVPMQQMPQVQQMPPMQPEAIGGVAVVTGVIAEQSTPSDE